ncbi:MAG: hypothetical protein WC364_11815 [Eubacteriales bacterium]
MQILHPAPGTPRVSKSGVGFWNMPVKVPSLIASPCIRMIMAIRCKIWARKSLENFPLGMAWRGLPAVTDLRPGQLQVLKAFWRICFYGNQAKSHRKRLSGFN